MFNSVAGEPSPLWGFLSSIAIKLGIAEKLGKFIPQLQVQSNFQTYLLVAVDNAFEIVEWYSGMCMPESHPLFTLQLMEI